MTINDYLKDLLEGQNISEDDKEYTLLEEHKSEVTDYLRNEFGSDPIIKYAGSKAKGTMLKDSYDLDIVCYFPYTDSRSLKDIHKDVYEHLEKEYKLEKRSSAIRILDLKNSQVSEDYHVDVVPGRFIEGTSDVFLPVITDERDRIQTNLKTHIDYIKNSGCVEIIRLFKLWKKRNNVTLKTFILEVFIVEMLKDSDKKNSLQDGVLQVLLDLKLEFPTKRLVDPANSGNVLSEIMTSIEKNIVSNMADNALKIINNSNILSNWKEVFKDTEVKPQPLFTPFTPNKPHGL